MKQGLDISQVVVGEPSMPQIKIQRNSGGCRCKFNQWGSFSIQESTVAIPNVGHEEDRSRAMSEGHMHQVNAHKEALTSTEV